MYKDRCLELAIYTWYLYLSLTKYFNFVHGIFIKISFCWNCCKRSLEMNISTRDVSNLESIIGFFKFFSIFVNKVVWSHSFRSFSFYWKCWNIYVMPFDKILRCMKFICSDYCMWASGEVIEKRSTCFNLLEDNRTRCCLKRAMCWMVVYIRQKHIEPSTSMKSNKFVKIVL